MTIKQTGGVFGRNPTFNDVTVEGDLTVDGSVVHTGDLTVDNINLSGNTISTTDTNGNLVLDPDGTGLVQIPNATAPTIELRNTKAWNSPEQGTFASIQGYTTDTSGTTGPRVVAEIELFNDAGSSVPGGSWIFKTSPGGGGAQVLTERARIGRSGHLTLASGNNVVFASGNGIDFSATAGTGTSELFDDYEEGTWTPSVSAGTISGTSITYTGNYTKIGDTVTAWFHANNSAGDIQISSYAAVGTLPFTAASSGTGVVATEDIDQFSRQGFAVVLGTTLYLSAAGSATGTTNLYCSVTYRV